MSDDRIEVRSDPRPPLGRDTPGRPPERSGGEAASLLDNRANIVNLVYLVGLFTAVPLLIGAVLAYFWKDAPDTREWERSHMRYHVRTFWLSIAYHILAFVMILSILLLPFGLLLWGGAFIFTVLRCIKSFTLAQNQRPMTNEGTWLW